MIGWPPLSFRLCNELLTGVQMIPFLIEQHHQGKYPLEKLSRYYNVKDIRQALHDMKSGQVLKPVLIWTGGEDLQN